MELFIGLDVGTSAVKGILLSAAGEKLALARRPIRHLYPQPGWDELEPEEHVREVFGVIAELAARVPAGGKVAGLAMAFASGNLMLLDREGQPLSNVFSWLDGRSVGKTPELLPELDLESFHEIVGWPYTELFPLAQIAWFRKNRPEAWARLGRVCMNNDYLSFRLTGRWGMDPSTATTFYLQNQVEGRWHRPYLELVGVEEEQLPALLPCGAVLGPLTPEAAAATGLSEQTLVVLGAFDHPCAARGTGTLDEGELLLSCGTSWVDYYPLHDRDLAVRMEMLIDPFLAPAGPWGCMAALTALGVTIEKHIDAAVLGPGDDPKRKYDIFNAAAQAAPAGAGGLLMDLYRHNRSFLQAIDTRQGTGHTREEVARALMEAAAFELRVQADRLAASGITARRITMVGGPTESPLWPRIVAEVAGLPLRLINGQTAGAVGAAVLAAVGCGLFSDEKEAFAAMGGAEILIEPEGANIRLYAGLFERYRERLGK